MSVDLAGGGGWNDGVPQPFSPGESSFSRVNALYLAHASAVAYHRAPAAEAEERLGLKTIAFRNTVTRTRGYLGVCDTHAVLAFRGTVPGTLPNWVTDAVVKLVECEHYEGRVHHGFSSALRRTWDKIEPLLDEAEGKPLFLTGHSLGGALALLAACRLAKADRAPVATYTFGAPRVGDPKFCAGHVLPTYRVVNRLDLVPEMPMASLQRLVPKESKFASPKTLARLKKAAELVRCYDHVNTFVYIDRDGVVTQDADIEPWHAHAVARAIATRGKSFLEGITDHLIGSYIRSLEAGTTAARPVGLRRRFRAD